MGSRDITAPFMMKITDREKRKPSALVVTRSVNKKKRRSQFATKFARNRIHHPRRVNNRVEPEQPGHLFFREVSAGHVNHNFPVRLHKAIGRLTASGRSDYVGSIVNKVVPNCRPKKFSVAIASKTPSIRTRVSPKEMKSTEN